METARCAPRGAAARFGRCRATLSVSDADKPSMTVGGWCPPENTRMRAGDSASQLATPPSRRQLVLLPSCR